jgi:phosphate transport system protein
MSESKHLSSQFAAELTSVSTKVMEMGGLVESQLLHSTQALAEFDDEMAARVIEREDRVNHMEVEIDRELISIIGRRQPTARDLRMLMAISRTLANLERVGDEAHKVARLVKNMRTNPMARTLPSSALRMEAELAAKLLRKALDALARLDVEAALSILKEDDEVDRAFDGFVRQLVTHMMEDARTIGVSLDMLTIAKSIERVGDHAKNIAESIIYIVKGEDVRHASIETVESVVR